MPPDTRQCSIPPIPSLQAIQCPQSTLNHTKIVKEEVVEELSNPVQAHSIIPKVWDVLVKHVFDKLEANDYDQNNQRKFLTLLAEIEELLGEFKCFMDACLQEAVSSDGFKLGPELCRAYNLSTNSSWMVKKPKNINIVYRQFFVGHSDSKVELYSDDEADYFDDNHAADHPEDIDLKQQDILTVAKSHQETQFFSCYLCKTTFDSANGLLQHKKQHHR